MKADVAERQFANLFLGRALVQVAGDRWWQQTRSVFVLSTGRTGTETLARLLDLGRRVQAFHEPRPQLLAERKQAFAEISKHAERYAAIFRKSRAAALSTARALRQVYAETSARMTFLAPVIARMMPQAQFVHLYRHPADVVRSGMRRGWYVNHPADAYRIEPLPGTPAERHWQHWSTFEKICWYWSAYHEFILDFAETVEAHRVLTLRSDELFRVTTGKWREIFEFLSIVPPAEADVRQVLGIRHNAQEQGEFPPWEAWTEEQRQTLVKIAGATMRRMGIPLDRPQPSVASTT